MIEIAELKEYLRIDNTDSDAELVILEAAAVDHVERLCAMNFGASGSVVDMRSGGVNPIFLSATPEATPVPVVESMSGSTFTPVATTDYSINGDRAYHVTTWPVGTYRFTYTAGYATGTEPESIRQAVKLLVSHWFEYRVPIVAGQSVSDVPHSVEAIVQSFRGYPVA